MQVNNEKSLIILNQLMDLLTTKQKNFLKILSLDNE
jgi:hypothetical protein